MNASALDPKAGDNRPPLITADALANDFAHVEKFVAEMEAEAAKVPPVIEDDEDLAVVAATVPKLVKAAKRVEELRVDNKRPYDDAGKVVHAFFKAFDARLATVQTQLEQRGKRYLDKKRVAEEAKRRAEEAKAREEAARKAAEAVDAAKAGDAAKAAVAQVAAEEAAGLAAAAAAPVKAAELARTHTAGGTATLAEKWDFQIDDLSKVDLNALRPFFTYAEIEKAVRGFVRAHQDKRPLDGVRVFKDTQARFSA